MSVAVDCASRSGARGFDEDFAQGGARGCGFTMFSAKLDDSPMFRKEIQSLEESAELLRDRCLKFYKGCRKYTEGLEESYDGDIAFSNALEMFGGGHNDPISVAFGGSVMTKFTIAIRELGTYKEVLRSQAENILSDRLLQFVDIYLNDVKDPHKRFEKASLLYDQARERYLSLKKGTKADIAAALEDDLHRARLSFEEARFNLVTALSIIEAKKRYEFLEAVNGTMDAHLRYFKQCYELLHQMEPYIHQVQDYVQQSREMYNYEQAALVERMQDFKRQIDRESQLSSNESHNTSRGDGIQDDIRRSSYKMIEAVMQSAAKGKVETIRQGYLCKRSSNLRGDWKRRFFILDNRGLLYYYRKYLNRRSGSSFSSLRGHSEHNSGLLSRWFSSHYHGGVQNAKFGPRHTVNLLTSTIKADADESDLRFCFRIISPTRNYTLQAESSADQRDWIEKITGVITSLLSSQLPEQHLISTPRCYLLHAASESSSFSSSCDLDHSVNGELSMEKNLTGVPYGCSVRRTQHHWFNSMREKPVDVLRKVQGNDVCADCGAPDPDWASLNLGLLLCIACSGLHRNLGVHISKVRSLTLDVRAWEPSVINLFQSLGNKYANSVWEQHLLKTSSRKCEEDSSLSMNDKNQDQLCCTKPKQSDHISVKEKFIHAKYAEKHFISRQQTDEVSMAQQLWHSVSENDKKGVYHHIVTSNVDINFTYQDSTLSLCLNTPKAMEQQIPVLDPSNGLTSGNSHRNASTVSHLNSSSTYENGKELDECFEGFTLLHLACWTADIGMIELLLQYGADINSIDISGRTPLHHCVLRGKDSSAKLLLFRGADPHSTDKDGKTPLQYAIDRGYTDDNEILALLKRAKESD